MMPNMLNLPPSFKAKRRSDTGPTRSSDENSQLSDSGVVLAVEMDVTGFFSGEVVASAHLTLEMSSRFRL